jgi:hypothetical protein
MKISFKVPCLLLLLAAMAFSPALSRAGSEKEHGTKAVKTLGAPVPNTGVEGRVVVDGKVLPGSRVFAYLTFEDFMDHKPVAVSNPTADDGKYRMDLPPGVFYLIAKKIQEGAADGPIAEGDYFSFQGSNPITVTAGKYMHVGFSVNKVAAKVSYEPYDNTADGAISGVVLYEGNPLEGAYVTLYVDTAEDLRGMTYATSPPTGKKGIFRFDNLPELDYFVVVRKRSTGKGAGPLGDGDYFGFYPLNPVQVHIGQVAKIEVPVVSKAGEIGMEDSLFRNTGTQITGKVVDKEGKPAKGVYVFGYLEKVMAHNRPEFISAVVDKEGRYVLNVEKGNTYYIGARSDYGDTPALGEWYGRWDGAGDHSVKVETGQVLKNIDIIVEQILP